MPDEFPRIIPTLIDLRKKAYSRMLGGLSSNNRRLISHAIGELAIAAVPDVGGVGRELDNALTPEEKEQIGQVSVELDEQTGQAIEALKQSIIHSGEPHNITHGAVPSMTFESPGLTLLALSIEELMTNLNSFKYSAPESSP